MLAYSTNSKVMTEAKLNEERKKNRESYMAYYNTLSPEHKEYVDKKNYVRKGFRFYCSLNDKQVDEMIRIYKTIPNGLISYLKIPMTLDVYRSLEMSVAKDELVLDIDRPDIVRKLKKNYERENRNR